MARPVGVPGRVWRWCRRKPQAASLAAAVMLTFLLGFAGVVWQWRHSEAQRKRAEAGELSARQNAYVLAMNAAQHSEFAQVTFDNLEVWQFESPPLVPQLRIQNSVVLSWPEMPGQYVLESAPGADGPWTSVPNPWLRTNNGLCEVSILAPDSLKVFRLRQSP